VRFKSSAYLVIEPPISTSTKPLRVSTGSTRKFGGWALSSTEWRRVSGTIWPVLVPAAALISHKSNDRISHNRHELELEICIISQGVFVDPLADGSEYRMSVCWCIVGAMCYCGHDKVTHPHWQLSKGMERIFPAQRAAALLVAQRSTKLGPRKAFLNQQGNNLSIVSLVLLVISVGRVSRISAN
jgi:hypothetical protein